MVPHPGTAPVVSYPLCLTTSRLQRGEGEDWDGANDRIPTCVMMLGRQLPEF